MTIPSIRDKDMRNRDALRARVESARRRLLQVDASTDSDSFDGTLELTERFDYRLIGTLLRVKRAIHWVVALVEAIAELVQVANVVSAALLFLQPAFAFAGVEACGL
jgi:hypothetical protein